MLETGTQREITNLRKDLQDRKDGYEVANRLAAEAAKLEKELYDLRKAVYSTPYRALIQHASWTELDRLMGDWSPDSGENNTSDKEKD